MIHVKMRRQLGLNKGVKARQSKGAKRQNYTVKKEKSMNKKKNSNIFSKMYN